MEHDPSPWPGLRDAGDLILWALLLTVLAIYLWALTAGPMSALDPAPREAPLPLQKPVSPAGTGPALV